jgi:hypothetical protein
LHIVFKNPRAQALFDHLAATLPALMSPKVAGEHLNESLSLVYADIRAGRLESFTEVGRRKRDVTGRSVAQLAAERLDAALSAEGPAKATASMANARARKPALTANQRAVISRRLNRGSASAA